MNTMNIIYLFIAFQSGEFYFQKGSFDWSPIIAALIAALVIIIGYSIQKINERENKNRENSKEAYLKFLNDFTETTVTEVLHDDYYLSKSKEEKKKLQIESTRRKLQARNHILLYGSDKVITAYLNYVKHIDEILTNNIEDKQVEFFTKLLLEIRNEIYKNTKITEDEISKYFNEYNRQ